MNKIVQDSWLRWSYIIVKDCLSLHCLVIRGRVPVWVGGWWCKVIIISNQTAVKVDLSCIEVRLGYIPGVGGWSQCDYKSNLSSQLNWR